MEMEYNIGIVDGRKAYKLPVTSKELIRRIELNELYLIEDRDYELILNRHNRLFFIWIGDYELCEGYKLKLMTMEGITMFNTEHKTYKFKEGNRIVTENYDKSGNPITRQFKNVSETMRYDNHNRLISSISKVQLEEEYHESIISKAYNRFGKPLFETTYLLYPDRGISQMFTSTFVYENGKLKKEYREQVYGDNHADIRVISYNYDQCGRLVYRHNSDNGAFLKIQYDEFNQIIYAEVFDYTLHSKELTLRIIEGKRIESKGIAIYKYYDKEDGTELWNDHYDADGNMVFNNALVDKDKYFIVFRDIFDGEISHSTMSGPYVRHYYYDFTDKMYNKISEAIHLEGDIIVTEYKINKTENNRIEEMKVTYKDPQGNTNLDDKRHDHIVYNPSGSVFTSRDKVLITEGKE